MCYLPVILKNEKRYFKGQKLYEHYPCGKCIECRKRMVNSWYIRLLNQSKISTSTHFVTLTYDDHFLPYTDTGEMTLNYRDFQLFMKKLRKRVKSIKISYFCAGEYGSKNYRPHYHAIIFNCPNIDFYSLLWTNGYVHVGNFSPASCYYTLKYCYKNIVDRCDDDPRLPQRALMSKGLGLNFLTDDMVKYYKDDVSRGVTLPGGKVYPLPRYYRDKIFDDVQLVRRRLSLSKFSEEKADLLMDNDVPHRIRVMEMKHKLKLSETN